MHRRFSPSLLFLFFPRYLNGYDHIWHLHTRLLFFECECCMALQSNGLVNPGEEALSSGSNHENQSETWVFGYLSLIL